ncbi:hypothetical protein G9A89_002825 [Geosiphon pyriformis]|nr:hypothetical protein G9A89_002825 [Geosiphon pyriformis]
MTSQPLQEPLPRDAKLISLLLQNAGVEDYEPKVVQQLLEFAHRYSVDVLQDSLIYSEHAGRINDIDIDDVKLAIQGRVNHSFTSPPPKEFLAELAKEKNKEKLPEVEEKYGLRLPPEHYCLTAVNFQLIPEGRQELEHQSLGPVDDPTPPSASTTTTQTPYSTNYPIYDEEDPIEYQEVLNGEEEEDEEDDDDNVLATFPIHTISVLPEQGDRNDDLFSAEEDVVDYDMPEADSNTHSTVTSPPTVGTEGWKRPRQEDDDYDD